MRRVAVASAVIGVALAVSSGAVAQANPATTGTRVNVSFDGVAAQDWAKANLEKSPRHGEFVTIHEPGGRDLQAWVVYPEVKDKAPVVVMIHEIFGLSDWAREMADEVAGAGYIVVEPDLLSGFGPPKMSAELQMPAPNLLANESATDTAEVQLRALWAKVSAQCEPIDCGPDQKPAVAIVENDGSNGQPVKVRLAYQTDAEAQGTDVHPAMFTPIAYGQQAPQQYHGEHSIMSDAQAQESGAPYVPARPGGTSAFPDQGSVTRAVSSLPDMQVMADLDAAADYGKKLPAASGKLYVAGFCWGGGKAFLFATHRHDLSAAFVFYGPPPPTELLKNITAPVYGFYAGNDARITATVPKTQDAMKGLGKRYEPVVYDGAGHGFMRAGEAPDASAPNAAARQQGFKRLVDLMGGVR